jgi:hypothetical protein
MPRAATSCYAPRVRLAKLPGWAVDDEASVRAEVADWVDATPAQRWEATRRCARGAAAILRFHADPSRALEWVDPLPETTRRALERLRSARGR